MVVPNEDGSYTILINAGLNSRVPAKGLMSMQCNILKNDDFQKETDVQEIEYHAHRHEIAEPAAKYLERIKRLQREHRAIKRQIERDKKRVQFIMENCDMYKRAEHITIYMVITYKVY